MEFWSSTGQLQHYLLGCPVQVLVVPGKRTTKISNTAGYPLHITANHDEITQQVPCILIMWWPKLYYCLINNHIWQLLYFPHNYGSYEILRLSCNPISKYYYKLGVNKVLLYILGITVQP